MVYLTKRLKDLLFFMAQRSAYFEDRDWSVVHPLAEGIKRLLDAPWDGTEETERLCRRLRTALRAYNDAYTAVDARSCKEAIQKFTLHIIVLRAEVLESVGFVE
jgi:hypothetical protein